MQKKDPKALVLQEIMDLMDEQMLGKRGKPEEPQPTDESDGASLGDEMATETPSDEDSIDPEMLRQLMEMNEEA